MQDTASPTSAFVRERCHTGPEYAVPVDLLWQAWKEWAEDNGVRTTGSKQLFGRNLQSVVPQLHRSRPRNDYGQQVPTYTGITLAAPELDPQCHESRHTAMAPQHGDASPSATTIATQRDGGLARFHEGREPLHRAPKENGRHGYSPRTDAHAVRYTAGRLCR